MADVLLTDIDGTLVDSNALHAEAWRRTFEHFGIETDLAQMWSQIGKGGDQVIPIFVPKADQERLEESIKKFRKDIFHRDYMARIVAFSKSRELLQKVKHSGMQIVIASSSEKEDLGTYGKIVKMDDLIDEASSSADAENSKPEGDIFAAAMKKVNAKPAQCIALGDTPWDAQAARKCDVPTIGLTCGGWKRQDLLDAGCIEVWQDPADLLLHYEQSALARR
ncbi:HAD family hydrolase [Acidipila sp. EB88]|uniref:HAD family hydrolase n=1 Tax=Acidipila sp. EB88 TaxID=2305226 RepID=UPI000F5FC30C|nr:HAD family hydrolase [Acidipila sp. EB88]RRA50033.1 HAD family hydrolase [Acidipila sp. EB88]